MRMSDYHPSTVCQHDIVKWMWCWESDRYRFEFQLTNEFCGPGNSTYLNEPQASVGK